MFSLKKCLVYCLLLISSIITAQEIKFGDVSKEAVLQTVHPLDSSANAAYLYKYRRTYYDYVQGEGFQLITDIHERIKIYNKNGFEYATKKINLYKSGSNKEDIGGLKAITFSEQNGKIVETKLKKDGMFKTELSRYFNQESFTMPNIKEGAVIDYKYKIISPFNSNVNDFVFQHDIPVDKIEATMEMPEYYNFRVNTKGYLPVRATTEMGNGKIILTSTTRNNNGWSSSSQQNRNEIDYTKNIDKYNITNVKALKEEPYVNNINNYRSAINYELSYTKFPQSAITHYATTWEDVVKKIYESSSFGAELNKSGYYDDDIDAIIGEISDPVKRASLIFNHVRSQVKWNEYYSYYTIDGVKKAYKERTGNVAEINLMLTSMLRYAGLKANPVLVSTRNNGIPIFPTREGYNYVISSFEIDGETVLLDATDPYSGPNVLPLRTLNWEGRIIYEDGKSKTIALMPTKKALDMVMISATPNTDGSIEGTLKEQYKKHYAMILRQQYNGGSQEEYLKGKETDYEGLEIEDFEIKNEKNLSKPVVQSFNFYKDDAVEVIGDKMYLNPMLFLAEKENPFKLKDREFPVDFGFPWSDNFIIMTTIPEGYQLESLPETLVLALPNGIGRFKYLVSTVGNTIKANISLEFNTAIISALDYPYLQEFYRQVVEKESEKVVLSKI